MNKRAVGYLSGRILLLEGIFMLPPLFLALFWGETKAATGFGLAVILTFFVGFLLLLCKEKEGNILRAREGFATVSLAWIAISLFGALPFVFSGSIPNFVDALFETVSGFTTTGASILSDVEALPKSILYWRSFTHWLGGMGVLVFFLAVVPQSKGSGDALQLMRAESPGPQVSKLVPSLRKSARILYSIYIGLTLLEFLLLVLGGMPVFDSLLHTFGTAGTGGFGIKNASIGAYDSYYLQGVIGVFMVLFGINFTVFYLLLIRQFKQALHNEELWAYLGIVAVSTVVIAINILLMYGSLFESIHQAFFQVASIMTTTGYSTTDFNLWPELSRMLLVALMILGACAGSTGGGLKISRLVILLKSLKNELQRLMHPRSVKVIKLDGKMLDDTVTRNVNVFLVIYCAICGVSILLCSLDNMDFETTVTGVLACVNNIGPGLGLVGPTGNYGMFSDFSKIVLSLDMLLGRLEIFPLLLLFTPSVWKRG